MPEERSTVPVLGLGEILVKVAAAGANCPDVRQRQGTYPPPQGVVRHSGSRDRRRSCSARRWT